MTRYEFANYFYVTGIRRSGNHAIQTWLTGLPEGPVVKLNYCPGIWGKRVLDMAAGYKGPTTSLVQGAEEIHPIRFFSSTEVEITAKNTKQVVIVRNPLNNFASKAKYGAYWFSPKNVETFLQAWCEYAEEWLDITSKLPDKVAVNYDLWFSSQLYRKELAEKLGVRFSDEKLNEMDDNWGISSFDRYDYQGCAQAMPVLDRWRNFENDARFRAFVDTLRAHAAYPLFRRIYGELPGQFAESTCSDTSTTGQKSATPSPSDH